MVSTQRPQEEEMGTTLASDKMRKLKTPSNGGRNFRGGMMRAEVYHGNVLSHGGFFVG